MRDATTEPLERLRRAVSHGEWGEALDLLETQWPSAVHREQETLRELLDAMPPSVLDGHPKLIRARDYLASRPGGTGAPRNGEDPASRLAALTRTIVAARRGGVAESALDAVRDARGLLARIIDDGHDLPALDDEDRAEHRYQWALALEEAGETAEAILECEAGYRSALAAGSDRLRVLTAGRAAYLRAVHGDNPGARELLEHLADAPADRWWSAGASLSAELARTLVDFDALDLEGARSDLSRVDVERVGQDWPAYFLTRAMVESEPRRARDLSLDFEAHLGTLRAGDLSGTRREYVRLVRYIHLATEKRMDRAHAVLGEDHAGARSTVLDQLATGLRAADLRRVGFASEARRLAEPLLGATDRPRVLMLAVLASARPTTEGLRRVAVLADELRLFWPVLFLRPQEREVVLPILDDLGRSAEAALLRSPRGRASAAPVRLTSREREVSERAALGASVATIAADLHVSTNTVKSQLRSAYRRLGVSSRRELFDSLHRLDEDDAGPDAGSKR